MLTLCFACLTVTDLQSKIEMQQGAKAMLEHLDELSQANCCPKMLTTH